MRLHNPWLGYLERTYDEYKAKILERLKVSNPEITDLRDTNLLVIIISIVSGIAEQLGFYIDKTARESYLSTAQKFSSVVKLVKILDYRIKNRLPAMVDIYFTYVDSSDKAVSIQEPGTIPAGTIVTTRDGMQFMTLETLTIPIGKSTGFVAAKQWELVQDKVLGETNGLPNQEIVLPQEYSHNSLSLTIDEQPWDRVQTLAASLPTDKHYIVDMGEDRLPRIVFGNGINGAKPSANKPVIATYYTTYGALGNEVPAGAIDTLANSTLVLPQPAARVLIRNTANPVAGADIEDIDSIRFNAPLSAKAVERAVTPADFDYLAKRADGVGKASIVYNCMTGVTAYISPTNGGIAIDDLVESTQEYLDGVKIVGVKVTVKAAGETPVAMRLEVTPRFRIDKTSLVQEIKDALLNKFSVANNQINGRIAVSDVLAVVDNMAKVDYVELKRLYTMPYAFPQGHKTQLNWERETLPGSSTKINWKLVYTPTGFRLFKNDIYLTTIPLNTEYTDPEGIVKFRLNPFAMYEPAMVWNFITYPYNQSIMLTDNTVPIITDGTLEIIVNNPQ